MEKLSRTMDVYGDGPNVEYPNVINDIINGPIRMDELQKAIKFSKIKKACGSDGIPMEF